MMASETFLASPPKDDQILPGICLFSKSSTYLVQTFLGQGTFGKVVKCMRMTDKKSVAIKMIKNEGSNITSAALEVGALQKLKNLDSDKCNLVQWHQGFIYGGHICLEFEHLDKSLFDFLKQRYYNPLPMKAIRSVTQQIATALVHLKSVGIVHADLKLENVMLVNHEQEPYRIKVIDFGLACNVSEARQGSYIQTCPYRSPEIILGLPFTEAIDMWSLGCIAATLYLGSLLYPGRSEYDMMRYIVETQGQPPDSMLNCGTKTTIFFKRDCNSTTSFWKLKTPELFFLETGTVSVETRRMKLCSLDDLLNIRSLTTENSADKVVEIYDLITFVQMLKGMLQLDAAQRMTPSQVLEHQFITPDYNTSMNPQSPCVKSCFETMGVCKMKTLISDSGTVVNMSLQQSFPTTTSSVQPSLHLPPAARSSLVELQHAHTHLSSSTKTINPVMSGVKRERDEEDGNMSRTLEPKRFKAAISDNHHGRSQAFANFTEACPNSKRPPADTLHQGVNICHTESVDKGKMTDGEAVGPSKSVSYHCERSDYMKKPSQKRVKKSDTGNSSHSSSQALHIQPDLRGSQTDNHHQTAIENSSRPGRKRKATDSKNTSHSRKGSSMQLEDGKARKKFCIRKKTSSFPQKTCDLSHTSSSTATQ